MLATVASRNLTKNSPRNSGFFIGKGEGGTGVNIPVPSIC